MIKLQRPSGNDVEKKTAALANELLNSVTTIHKFHLRITGTGSYAAHKALNEFYDEIGEHADDVVEKYQGAAEKLLDIPDTAPKRINTVAECVDYFRDLTKMIDELQSIMPYSELVNILDEAKALIDGTKYKLIFLK
jgi:DNA-binding ferritin-like protein